MAYNPAEDAFYACSGDIDGGHGKECHWLRGTYDSKADSWDWKVIVSSDANSRFKSGGINFVDGKVYWVADANGPKTLRETYDRGIFRCDPADIPNKDKHTRIFPAEFEIACMTIHGQVILAPHYGNATPTDCGFIISNGVKPLGLYFSARISRGSLPRLKFSISNGVEELVELDGRNGCFLEKHKRGRRISA